MRSQAAAAAKRGSGFSGGTQYSESSVIVAPLPKLKTALTTRKYLFFLSLWLSPSSYSLWLSVNVSVPLDSSLACSGIRDIHRQRLTVGHLAPRSRFSAAERDARSRFSRRRPRRRAPCYLRQPGQIPNTAEESLISHYTLT